MPAAGHAGPVLAVGDGTLGFWAALREVLVGRPDEAEIKVAA
jgi:hypothetical protein